MLYMCVCVVCVVPMESIYLTGRGTGIQCPHDIEFFMSQDIRKLLVSTMLHNIMIIIIIFKPGTCWLTPGFL